MVYLRGDYGALDAEEISRVLARVGKSEPLSDERAGVIREQLSAGVVDVHAFLVQRCAATKASGRGETDRAPHAGATRDPRRARTASAATTCNSAPLRR